MQVEGATPNPGSTLFRIVPIQGDGHVVDIHFAALFSENTAATPIVLLHGWPGSFLEFLDVLDFFRSKYDPKSLPYHIIVLPFPVEDVASLIDKLMNGLGFGEDYVVQGGDIGSFVARVLGVTSKRCRAVHINFCAGIQPPDDVPYESLGQDELRGLARAEEFSRLGDGYGREHGTRPATISLALSSSPVALLAWVGEKFLEWTDEELALEQILDLVTFYWLTDSFPRAIYPYRQFYGANPTSIHGDPKYHICKPLGYSWFPKEIAPMPVAWVAKTGNLIWHRNHKKGGHFAALETPLLYAADLEDFVREALIRKA